MESRIALVASFLFGIHPLHVESVAWAAELKDLMYTFFFLSSYILYLKFIRNPKASLYVFAVILFLLSLLSKAMAASLPVVMLLTDYFLGRKFNAKTIFEKVPFFILAFVFGAIAVTAQKTAGATDMVVFPFVDRIVFASYGFIAYLVKLVLPINLSAYYPYPVKPGEALPFLYYAHVLFMLILIALVFYSLRYNRKIFFGVGFFAITIFLVLQLLPVGGAMMADRYSYLPSVGIFYLAGEGLNVLWNKKPRWISTGILIAFGLFFTVTCYARCQVWRNSLALWNDVIKKYQTISHAYNNRCLMHLSYKNYDLAIGDCTKAIQLDNNYSEAYINRGNVYREVNRLDESLSDYNKAAELTPNFYKVYINRGILHLFAQRYNLAHMDFDKTLSLNPKFEEAYYHHGLAYYNERMYDKAIESYTQAIRLKPNFGMAYYSRAISEFYSGKKEIACKDLKQSARLGYQVPEQVMSLICK
jgi:Tfp pilus assembly protein PilF